MAPNSPHHQSVKFKFRHFSDSVVVSPCRLPVSGQAGADGERTVSPDQGKSLLPPLDKVEEENPDLRALYKDLCVWSNSLLGHSSLHAVGWVPLITNMPLKLALFCAVGLVMLTLPVVVFHSISMYYNNEKVITSVEYREANSMSYPNITVCHPKFFDKRKFKNYDMPEEMADYLAMSMDPGLGDFVKFMTTVEGAGDYFIDQMDNFENILDNVLQENQMSFLDLFTALAIDCEDFILFCSYHNKFFVSPFITGANHTSCCQDLFGGQRPTFSSAGTCYTTNTLVTEDLPSTYSSLEIYADVRTEITPKYQTRLSNTKASTREGIQWALSSAWDHPPAVMVAGQRRAAESTMTTVGLQKIETDRSLLKLHNQKPCTETNDSFAEETGGLNYTKKNCGGLLFHHVYPNCSLAVIMGYKQKPDLPACLPKDMIRVEGEQLREYRDSLPNVISHSSCPYECHKSDFEVLSSTSGLNNAALSEYANLPIVLESLNRTTLDMSGVLGLQFYFQTFSYSVSVLSQETLFDTLSKIGGTMGLAIGASICSFLEIALFVISLFGIILKRIRLVRIFS